MKRPWTSEQDNELRAIYAAHASDLMQLRTALRKFRARNAFPPCSVRRRAVILGIARRRCAPWTVEEIQKLENWAGDKSIAFMMRTLHRSHASITNKLQQMKLRYQLQDGYTASDLMKAFGLGWYSVDRWFQEGLLKPSPDTGRVSESDVIRLIKLHPEQYSLKRVDEVWFKGMLFPSFGSDLRASGSRRNGSTISSQERVA